MLIMRIEKIGQYCGRYAVVDTHATNAEEFEHIADKLSKIASFQVILVPVVRDFWVWKPSIVREETITIFWSDLDKTEWWFTPYSARGSQSLI